MFRNLIGGVTAALLPRDTPSSISESIRFDVKKRTKSMLDFEGTVPSIRDGFRKCFFFFVVVDEDEARR